MALELQGFTPSEPYHPTTKKFAEDSINAVTTHGAFLYISSAGTTSIPVTGTYYKANVTTVSGGSNGDIDISTSNRITYTGVEIKYFLIDISLLVSTASNTQTIGVKIAKNGVVQGYSEMEIFAKTANENYNCALNVFASLEQNEYIEVFLTNKSSTASVITQKLQFRANSIFTA